MPIFSVRICMLSLASLHFSQLKVSELKIIETAFCTVKCAHVLTTQEHYWKLTMFPPSHRLWLRRQELWTVSWWWYPLVLALAWNVEPRSIAMLDLSKQAHGVTPSTTLYRLLYCYDVWFETSKVSQNHALDGPFEWYQGLPCLSMDSTKLPCWFAMWQDQTQHYLLQCSHRFLFPGASRRWWRGLSSWSLVAIDFNHGNVKMMCSATKWGGGCLVSPICGLRLYKTMKLGLV